MFSWLNNLFNNEKKDSTDGLTQPQREAIVDLLLFCMYADNYLSHNESAFFQRKVDQMSWQSGIEPESYINSATARARTATESSTAREHFLQHIAERLQNEHVRHRALDLCRQLFKSDDKGAEAETKFYGELERYLK